MACAAAAAAAPPALMLCSSLLVSGYTDRLPCRSTMPIACVAGVATLTSLYRHGAAAAA